MRPPARALLPIVLVLAAALLGTSCASGDDAADAPSPGEEPTGDDTAGAGTAGDASALGKPVADEEPLWLYTFTADTAAVTGDASGVTVDLADVSESTTAFTDRPERRTRSESTPGLVARWDTIFGDDPPNVVISGRDTDGPTSVVVEVRDIEVTAPGALRLGGRLLDGSAPADLTGVAVTVDDAAAGPCAAHIPWNDEISAAYRFLAAANLLGVDATTTAAPITITVPRTGGEQAQPKDLRVSALASGEPTELPADSVPTFASASRGLSASIPPVDSWADIDGTVSVSVTATLDWPGGAYSVCGTAVEVQPAG